MSQMQAIRQVGMVRHSLLVEAQISQLLLQPGDLTLQEDAAPTQTVSPCN